MMMSLILFAVLATSPLDARVIEFFSDIVLRAQLSNDFGETAAFLVRDSRGDVQCLLWPTTDEFQRQTFRGEPPAGTIAIVHTHPKSRPRPSENDIAQAQRVGLPFFILTRSDITVVDPASGKSTPVVAQRAWLSARVSSRCEADWLAR
jgi:hypothetical protein